MSTQQEITENLDRVDQETRPRSNYVKFADNERRVLIFNGDTTHTSSENNPQFGMRYRFVVTDVTDPMRPQENLIWNASPRWGQMVTKYIRRNEECLEITRQGNGTSTQYLIIPAKTE